MELEARGGGPIAFDLTFVITEGKRRVVRQV